MADNKPKKPAFDLKSLTIPKLSETQWAMVAGGLFLLIYVLSEFVFVGTPQTTIQDGINAPVQAGGETEEQRFKRENKNTHLPDGSSISDTDIKEKTILTQQVPFGDTELEFRMRLPRSWVMSEFARYGLRGEENYNVLTNIARYFGPTIEDARPFVWVEVERIKRYMTAETWAHAYMIKRGIAPEALQVESDTAVEALYVEVRDLRSYAVRSKFKIEGDTMIIISFGVPLESYKEYKDIMAIPLKSFELVRPIERQIEKINDYRLLNVMKFKYYASWLPKNEYNESTLHPSVELHNPLNEMGSEGISEGNEDLRGLLLINMWRKSPQYPAAKNMEEITDRLQELSMVIKKPLDKSKTLSLKGYTKVVQTPYLSQLNTYVRKDQFDIIKSEASKTMQEVWITTLDNDYYVAYLTLITPMKSNNYVIWAQNMAAYELLIKTLELREAPKNDY